MELQEALNTLEPNNDEHWTAKGLPRIEVVAELVGNEDLKRVDINDIAPDFCRVAKPALREVETKVLSHEEKLAVKLSEKQSEMGVLTKKISELSKQQKALGYEINYIGGALDNARSNRSNTDVQDYLAGQNKLRAEKAKTLKALNVTGINDVLKSVSKAPIDAAMNVRKAPRGSQRPNKSMTI